MIRTSRWLGRSGKRGVARRSGNGTMSPGNGVRSAAPSFLELSNKISFHVSMGTTALIYSSVKHYIISNGSSAICISSREGIFLRNFPFSMNCFFVA